jgi:NAD(P)-dependent dehydrogenase (short-subunit alcohol dehydrogenase family)
MKNFKNKTVVITGAGSGIGLALARAFAQHGAKLALNDVHATNLEQVRKELADKTEVFVQCFDVGKEQAVQEFAQAVHAHFQRVDVVINNAGVTQTGSEFSEISSEDFRWLMDINFWGVVYGCRYFLPYLRQQKESSLVNVSSLFGIIGSPSQTSYNASKFAVRGLSEALVLEERSNETGVAVSAVHPGGIKTNILRNAKGFVEEDLTKQEKIFRTPAATAAKIIIKGIRKKESRILVGNDAHLVHHANKFLRGIVQKATLRLYKQTK